MVFKRLESSRELREELRRHPVAVVVFTGLACPACEMYRPVVEEAARLLGDDVAVVEYVVDYDPEPAIELGIMGTPTTVVYIDGEPVEGFVGAVDLPELLEYLARVLRERRPDVADKVERLAARARPIMSYW